MTVKAPLDGDAPMGGRTSELDHDEGCKVGFDVVDV